MFHIFRSRKTYLFLSQKERKRFRSSAFLELQYCRMDAGTSISKIVSVNCIEHWKDDSLYVYMDDISDFIRQYAKLFGCGVYKNQNSGPIDMYGINYFSPEKIDESIAVIEKEKPIEYQTVLNWLNKAKEYNGFYILGI